ncbi:MAG: cell division topological specificity factor MinE [Candidatus Neomarinimicrobiota bacterium]
MLDYVREILSRALRRYGGVPGSKDAARQRLQVILVQDRFALPTKTLEAMKNDLITVISKYVDIDRDSIEVEIKRTGGAVVLISNIPITDGQRGAPERQTKPPRAVSPARKQRVKAIKVTTAGEESVNAKPGHSRSRVET